MSTVTLINTPEDVQWLRDVHLPKDAPEFKCATLLGNEDCPRVVMLYSCNRIDAQIAEYRADSDGNLVRHS
jgi:hypothetical protein